ncbi:unnamed protein product, partial [Musa acuminata var. zebrina]
AQLHIFIILLEKNSYTNNFFFLIHAREHIKEFSPDGWWPYWPKLLSLGTSMRRRRRQITMKLDQPFVVHRKWAFSCMLCISL